jgi:hypothetical protein
MTGRVLADGAVGRWQSRSVRSGSVRVGQRSGWEMQNVGVGLGSVVGGLGSVVGGRGSWSCFSIWRWYSDEEAAVL